MTRKLLPEAYPLMFHDAMGKLSAFITYHGESFRLQVGPDFTESAFVRPDDPRVSPKTLAEYVNGRKKRWGLFQAALRDAESHRWKPVQEAFNLQLSVKHLPDGRFQLWLKATRKPRLEDITGELQKSVDSLFGRG